MKVSYFPGCTLKTKAKELDAATRASAEALGITLEEIPDWQCCGGVFVSSRDEIATKLSSIRALKYAASKNQALVSVCSACHNVLKQTNYAMQTDEEFAFRANTYIGDETVYEGQTEVLHFLELLRDQIGFDEIAKRVTNPLKGRRIAAYYGCLLLRPSGVMGMDDPENPTILEDFIRALGAEPVIYGMRNECCGGYITVKDKAQAQKQSMSVLQSACNAGADSVITACPLCRYNLTKNTNAEIPVLYFTQLLCEALGIEEAKA